MKALAGVLVALHVLSSVVGFGAVAATGVVATIARRSPTAPSVARYFRRGRNWASHAMLLVPVLGAGTEAANGWPDVHDAWPWIALGIWMVAAVTGFAVHWPAERAVQVGVPARRATYAVGPGSAPEPAPTGPCFARACARAAWSSALMTVAFAGALAVMVVQPR